MHASIRTTQRTIIIIAAILAAGCVDTADDTSTTVPGGDGVVACQTGQSSCASLTEARACGVDGSWTTTACGADQVCEDGSCAALLCTPKAASCDGAKAMVCSSRGTKSNVVETCGTGKACVAGKCVVAECSPGEANCVGNTLVRCLDGETTWQKTVCSKEESCDPTGGPNGEPACKEQICLPGTAACDAGKAMVCSKDGLKQELTDDCAKAGKDGKDRACLAGKCVAKVCTPGEKTCLGNELATCSDNRVEWKKTACAKGEICSAGACAKKK